MIDLEIFMKSLKICWIKRMIESEDDGLLKNLYLNKLNQFGGKLLFESNYSENEIDIFTQNVFFKRYLSSLVSLYQTSSHQQLQTRDFME